MFLIEETKIFCIQKILRWAFVSHIRHFFQRGEEHLAEQEMFKIKPPTNTPGSSFWYIQVISR